MTSGDGGCYGSGSYCGGRQLLAFTFAVRWGCGSLGTVAAAGGKLSWVSGGGVVTAVKVAASA